MRTHLPRCCALLICALACALAACSTERAERAEAPATAVPKRESLGPTRRRTKSRRPHWEETIDRDKVTVDPAVARLFENAAERGTSNVAPAPKAGAAAGSASGESSTTAATDDESVAKKLARDLGSLVKAEEPAPPPKRPVGPPPSELPRGLPENETPKRDDDPKVNAPATSDAAPTKVTESRPPKSSEPARRTRARRNLPLARLGTVFGVPLDGFSVSGPVGRTARYLASTRMPLRKPDPKAVASPASTAPTASTQPAERPAEAKPTIPAKAAPETPTETSGDPPTEARTEKPVERTTPAPPIEPESAAAPTVAPGDDPTPAEAAEPIPPATRDDSTPAAEPEIDDATGRATEAVNATETGTSAPAKPDGASSGSSGLLGRLNPVWVGAGLALLGALAFVGFMGFRRVRVVRDVCEGLGVDRWTNHLAVGPMNDVVDAHRKLAERITGVRRLLGTEAVPDQHQGRLEALVDATDHRRQAVVEELRALAHSSKMSRGAVAMRLRSGTQELNEALGNLGRGLGAVHRASR